MATMAGKMINDHKLISLVEARNAIYDKTDRFYTSKTHVRNAWREIAIEMNVPALICQKRWRYLRDYFVRQLHTLSENKSNDQPSSGKKKTLWSLFERLKFLTPFSSSRRGRSKAISDYSYMHDAGHQQQSDDLNSVKSLSSNSSVHNSYELNYLRLLQYQQQVGDYLQPSSKDTDNCLVEDEVEQVGDMQHYENDHDDSRGNDGGDEEDVESTVSDMKPEPSIDNFIDEDQIAGELSIAGRPCKRKRSEMQNELDEFLRTKRLDVECDEHEHFFKSLLNSVRKIDEDHIMSFRTEVMQLVSKYRCMASGENMLGNREDPSQIVVIETDQLHWRKNLRKYNRV